MKKQIRQILAYLLIASMTVLTIGCAGQGGGSSASGKGKVATNYYENYLNDQPVLTGDDFASYYKIKEDGSEEKISASLAKYSKISKKESGIFWQYYGSGNITPTKRGIGIYYNNTKSDVVAAYGEARGMMYDPNNNDPLETLLKGQNEGFKNVLTTFDEETYYIDYGNNYTRKIFNIIEPGMVDQTGFPLEPNKSILELTNEFHIRFYFNKDDRLVVYILYSPYVTWEEYKLGKNLQTVLGTQYPMGGTFPQYGDDSTEEDIYKYEADSAWQKFGSKSGSDSYNISILNYNQNAALTVNDFIYDELTRFWLENNESTSRNIKVGDSFDKVIEAYGKTTEYLSDDTDFIKNLAGGDRAANGDTFVDYYFVDDGVERHIRFYSDENKNTKFICYYATNMSNVKK